MNKKYQIAGGVAAVALLAAVGVTAISSAGDNDSLASAKLIVAGGTEIGTVKFAKEGNETRVKADLNVPASARGTTAFHGFHIHANNDPANGEGCVADPAAAPNTWFAAVDGHWKEGDQAHGKHRGDMPPLLLDANGKASASFLMPAIKADELKGKAVIMHVGADNLNNVPVGDAPNQYKPNTPAALTGTAAVGNAGDRVVCGVVTTD